MTTEHRNVLFADFVPDKTKGSYLAFSQDGKLVAQGDVPKRVASEARKKGCACPLFLSVELFEDRVYVL